MIINDLLVCQNKTNNDDKQHYDYQRLHQLLFQKRFSRTRYYYWTMINSSFTTISRNSSIALWYFIGFLAFKRWIVWYLITFIWLTGWIAFSWIKGITFPVFFCTFTIFYIFDLFPFNRIIAFCFPFSPRVGKLSSEKTIRSSKTVWTPSFKITVSI